jgi:cell division protein FtsQ
VIRYEVINRAGNRGYTSGVAVVVLLFLVTASGFAWVSTGIVANDRWPIRWLEVNGSFQRVSAEQLRGSLTPLIDASFFTVDLQGLRQATLRNNWVSAVNVQKTWPDTVIVTIEEYVPLAHWNRGKLISRRGEAFAVPEADGIQGLPWLQGPEDRLEDVLECWSEYSELLVPLDLEIRSLTLDRRGAWSMVLNNGTGIRLGRESPGERFRRLLISWDSLLAGKALPPQDIDMRYSNGFAVLWPQHVEKERGADS